MSGKDLEYIDVVNKREVSRETALELLDGGHPVRIAELQGRKRHGTLLYNDKAWLVNGEVVETGGETAAEAVLLMIEADLLETKDEEPPVSAPRKCPLLVIAAAVYKEGEGECLRNGCAVWAAGACGLIRR